IRELKEIVCGHTRGRAYTCHSCTPGHTFYPNPEFTLRQACPEHSRRAQGDRVVGAALPVHPAGGRGRPEKGITSGCPYLSKYVRLEPRFDLVHERLHCPCATLERLRREFKDQVLYADLLIGTQAGGYGVKITAQQVAAWPGGIRQDLVRDPLDKQ